MTHFMMTIPIGPLSPGFGKVFGMLWPAPRSATILPLAALRGVLTGRGHIGYLLSLFEDAPARVLADGKRRASVNRLGQMFPA
jgi:hypothetical protein